MALIQNLTNEDLKELQAMKDRGEVKITPNQEEELAQKTEEALEILSRPSTSLTADERRQYEDLATAIGALGIANNSSRLASLSTKMQNLLEKNFP